MKKILVPTDFSKPAEWAVDVAIDIALKSDGQIVLLHIVEHPTKESFNVEGQIDQLDDWEDKLFTLKLIERNRSQLSDLESKIRAHGIPVKRILRLGNPYHGISTAVTEQKVDLIIMGTSSHSVIEEMFLGSNTEKVVRFSKCPVLTIHQKSNANFRNIVYATSMSEHEKGFVDVVVNAQKMYGSIIHLVRINTPMNFRPDHEVKAMMKHFAAKHKFENYTLNVFNDVSEEAGIIHFANSINADLIAMATHGRTGFSHVLIGSIAENVVNHASKPVLTYITPTI